MRLPSKTLKILISVLVLLGAARGMAVAGDSPTGKMASREGKSIIPFKDIVNSRSWQEASPDDRMTVTRGYFKRYFAPLSRSEHDKQLAMSGLMKTAGLYTDDAPAYYNLGNTYGQQGNYAQALAAFKHAIRLKPDFAKAYYNLGLAYYFQQNYAKAINAYQHAIRLKPDYAWAYDNLGNVYKAQKNYPQAIQAYQQAIRLKPDFPPAYYNLGNTYGQQGNYAQALAAFKHAIRLKPDFAKAYNVLGAAYYDQKNYAKAINSYQQAIRLKPDFADAYFGLGIAYAIQKNYAEAIVNLKKAEALFIAASNFTQVAQIKRNLRLIYAESGFKPSDFAPVARPPLMTAQAPKPRPRERKGSLGTGFIFGDAGLVLTNYHVVRGAKSISVKYRNGKKTGARLITQDRQNDIAVLRPDRFPGITPVRIAMGDSSRMRLGDRVFTLGYPIANILGKNLKFSEGAISSLAGVGDDPGLFQISVPIQPGNSGGPLFNEKGEVVGIVSSSLDSRVTQAVIGNAPQNVNFAVKSSRVRDLLPTLPKSMVAPTDLSLDAVDPPSGSPRSLSDFVERVKDNIVLIHAK